MLTVHVSIVYVQIHKRLVYEENPYKLHILHSSFSSMVNIGATLTTRGNLQQYIRYRKTHHQPHDLS